jgi:hypothetical protein
LRPNAIFCGYFIGAGHVSVIFSQNMTASSGWKTGDGN